MRDSPMINDFYPRVQDVHITDVKPYECYGPYMDAAALSHSNVFDFRQSLVDSQKVREQEFKDASEQLLHAIYTTHRDKGAKRLETALSELNKGTDVVWKQDLRRAELWIRTEQFLQKWLGPYKAFRNEPTNVRYDMDAVGFDTMVSIGIFSASGHFVEGYGTLIRMSDCIRKVEQRWQEIETKLLSDVSKVQQFHRKRMGVLDLITFSKTCAPEPVEHVDAALPYDVSNAIVLSGDAKRPVKPAKRAKYVDRVFCTELSPRSGNVPHRFTPDPFRRRTSQKNKKRKN